MWAELGTGKSLPSPGTPVAWSLDKMFKPWGSDWSLMILMMDSACTQAKNKTLAVVV